MADLDNSLLLENLKAIRGELGLLRGDIQDLASEMRGMKAHMAGFLSSDVTQDSAIAAIRVRLDRIERRLELAD